MEKNQILVDYDRRIKEGNHDRVFENCKECPKRKDGHISCFPKTIADMTTVEEALLINQQFINKIGLGICLEWYEHWKYIVKKKKVKMIATV